MARESDNGERTAGDGHLPDGASHGAENKALGAPRQRQKGRGLVKGLLIAFAVIGVLAAGLFVGDQYIARYILTRQLETVGIEATGIDTLEIDLLDQEITAGPVRFKAADAVPGEIGRVGIRIGFTELFKRRALAERIILEGIDLHVTRADDGGLALNGVPLTQLMQADAAEPEQPADDEPGWGGGVDTFELRDARVFFDDQSRGGEIIVVVVSLTLNGFRTWEPDNPGSFDLEARVNDIDFNWQGEARPFGETVVANFEGSLAGVNLERIIQYTGALGFNERSGTLSSDTTHRLVISPDGRIELTSKGQIELVDFVNSRPDGIRLLTDHGVMDLDVRYVLTPENVSQVTGASTVTLEPLTVELPTGARFSSGRAGIETADLRVEIADAVSVAGPLRVDLNSAEADLGEGLFIAAETINLDEPGFAVDVGGTTSLKAKPTLTASAIEVQTAANVKAETLEIGLGETVLEQEGAGTALNTAGAMALGGLDVRMPQAAGRPPMTAEAASIDVDLHQMTVDISEAALGWRIHLDGSFGDLKFSAGDGEMLSANVQSLSLGNLNADQSLALAADTATIGKSEISLNKSLFAAFGDGGAATVGGDAPSPTVRLGKGTVATGSVIDFTDASVEPAVRVTTRFDRFEVTDLDMTDVSRRTAIAVAARINEFTEANADGWVAPWGEKPDFDIEARVADLALPTFSPYAATAIGVYIESGVLDTTTNASAEAGTLDGLINMTFRDLAFSPLTKADARRLSANVGVPIETVVGLLENRNGVIDLSIPLSGDLTNPEFDLSNAIGQAVRGAMVGAITAPFSLLFAPVQAVAGAVAPEQTFKPITFEPELARPDAECRPVIGQLSELLRERPELNLKVCGRATKADLASFLERNGYPPASSAEPPEALMEQAGKDLTALAKQRTQIVRRAVLDAAQLPPERLTECRPVYDPNDTRPPRAEITF